MTDDARRDTPGAFGAGGRDFDAEADELRRRVERLNAEVPPLTIAEAETASAVLTGPPPSHYVDGERVTLPTDGVARTPAELLTLLGVEWRQHHARRFPVGLRHLPNRGDAATANPATRRDVARRLHTAAERAALRLCRMTGSATPLPADTGRVEDAEAAFVAVRDAAKAAAESDGGEAATGTMIPADPPTDGCAYPTKARDRDEASRRAVELVAADPAFAKPPNLTARKWADRIGCGKTLAATLPFFRQCKAEAGEPVGLHRRRGTKKEAEPLTAATSPTVGDRDGVLGVLAEAEAWEAERKRELAKLMAEQRADARSEERLPKRV